MKFLFFFAALTAVALAEVEVFIGEKQILLNDEVLKGLDIKHLVVKHGEGEIADLEIPEGKNAVDDLIIAFLEDIRDKLDVGFPELGIPPLDPFEMDKFQASFGDSILFRATLTMNDISLTGLQKFIIETIKFNIVRLGFEGGIDIPLLAFDTDFNVKGRITLVVPFEFGSHFSMKLSHFRFYTNMALGTTPDGYLTLRKMELELSVEKTQLHFDNIIGDGPLNEIANYIMNLITNGFLKDQIEKIGEELGAALFETINAALGTIKLSDIIG